MVELEVDVVQKVAVGFRLIRGGTGAHIAHRNKAEQRIRLAGGDGIQIILAQIHGGAAAAVAAARAALRVGAIGVPRVGAAGGPAAGHDPDVPLLGIDGTGGQAEGVVARVIFKRAFGGEFFAVNGVLLRFGPGGNGTVIYLQPVHHLHELIPAILAGLGGVDALLGADHQRHDILAVSRAMVKAPFVHAGRGGFHVLVQRAFLVRVQLGGVGAVCRLQGDAINIDVGIFSEQLDLSLKRRGIPGGNRALIRLRIVAGKGRPFFKAAVLQFSIVFRCRCKRRRARHHQQAKHRCKHTQPPHRISRFVLFLLIHFMRPPRAVWPHVFACRGAA